MLLAFHCEGWGWAAGRIGGTCANDANVSVLYEGRWREDHSLFSSDYSSTGGTGSWTLLEPARAASPLLDFANGRYKVTRGSNDKWLRADELVHHSGGELAAARAKTAAAAAATSAAVAADELDTGEYAVGRRVFAKGLGPDGDVAWFVASVVGHRERFPPLQIAYLATHPGGETSALHLPVPRMAFVPATHVSFEDPSDLRA